MADFQRLLDLIMPHYNQILASLNRRGEFEPVLETDARNGDVLWEMWMDGFARAMALAPDGWRRVADSDDVGSKAALKGIKTLIDFAGGTMKLSRNEEDRWDIEAPDLIPIWVELFHTWRLKNDLGHPTASQRQIPGQLLPRI